ncbi:MAG TPA: YiiX/YebB-like N1pC/P60 family cysteine hydrolase [Anaerolineales bacterium]
MIYTYEINGLPIKTGDIVCTMNGKPNILPGEFWRLVGRLVPGDVDHVAMYLGPEGRFVEAGALGVGTFHIHGGLWQPEQSMLERGMLVDTFYGVAYPLMEIGLTRDEENDIRAGVADYCLSKLGKPYNLNFLDPDREDAFYCSQLVYKAYLPFGVNLNTGLFMEHLPGTNAIVFPQEIWSGNPHRRDEGSQYLQTLAEAVE